MRLLLLQISDIHIKTPGDSVLKRASRVADAVRDLDHELDLCIVALTGDVAYAGVPEQYAIAEDWIRALVASLEGAFDGRVPVKVVAIPGNHDVDLRQPLPIRSTVIDAMLKNAGLANDPMAEASCVQPQEAFFEFRDAVASDGLVVPGRVYYEYRFEAAGTEAAVQEGDALADAAPSVRVICCNTAWVSQNPETQGRLVFPDTAIRRRGGAAGGPVAAESVVVALLHHPYNWMEPMNARDVRRALQDVADVILTGHEHAPGVRQQQDEAGGCALYVEGLALQGHGGAHPTSEFYAIYVDATRQQRRVIPLIWKEKRYEVETGPTTAWQPFEKNPLRAGHLFPLKEAMRTTLSDAGVTLAHPTRGPLKLDDIFVYPDLDEVRYEPGARQEPATRGEQMFEVAAKSGRLLITGADDSGKSTFAKRVFIDALNAGYVPLLLDGHATRLKGDDRDRRILRDAFEDQYDAPGDGYLDTPAEKRVIVLDDFTALKTGDRPSQEVLDYLTHFAGVVVLFAHDVAQQVLDLVGLAPAAKGRVPFDHYRLLPVSHLRREEYIERYLSLAGKDSLEDREELRAEMRKTLRLAVGTYYAPPVPVSVVSILQALAFKDQLNISQSTYAYFYELLIKRALMSNTSLQELNVRIGYLTELAYEVHLTGKDEWDEAWMMQFHQAFLEERLLDFKYPAAVSALEAAEILVPTRTGYKFRYPYTFYYFVSRALAARITTEEGRGEIRGLTERLDQQDPANILLFLTHHSTDAAIIDPMLERAEMLFANVPRADLTMASVEVPGLDEALRGAVYQDAPVEHTRRDVMRQRDEVELERRVLEGPIHSQVAPVPDLPAERAAERDAAVAEAVGLMSRIYMSFRTMQILGQVLKNFPGTLSGDQKLRITRAVYGVALRTLGAVHGLLREHREDHSALVVNALRLEHPDMPSHDLLRAARNTVHWQLFMSALGVTQRTAADVGNPLLDLVYRRIESEDPVPAIRLITAAIDLDSSGAFPEAAIKTLAEEFHGNAMATLVLRQLVVAHFHLFGVEWQVKQRVCSLLKIEYRPELPSSRRRLIASRTT